MAIQILTDMGGTKLLTKVHFGAIDAYSVEFSNDCEETGQSTRPPPPTGSEEIANVWPFSTSDSWWTCTWFGHIDHPSGAAGGRDLEFPKPVEARWAKLEAMSSGGTPLDKKIQIFFEGSDQ